MDIIIQPITCMEDKTRECETEISLICYPGCCGSACFPVL